MLASHDFYPTLGHGNQKQKQELMLASHDFYPTLGHAYPTLGHGNQKQKQELMLASHDFYPTLGHGNQKQKQIKSENLSYSSKSSQITLNPQLLGYPQHCDTAILKLGYLTPALELGSPLYN